jgi:hypothetical protein
MLLRAPCVAATVAALFFANPASAGREPHLDLVLQPGLSHYTGDGLPRVCEGGRGCAAGDSLAARLGLRVAEGFDAVFAFRKAWADHPSRIYEASLDVAWWPTEGIFSSRLYLGAGVVLVPGTAGFDAHLGGELMVFPVNFFGLGLAAEIGPVGFLGGSSLRTSHLGAAIHLRL